MTGIDIFALIILLVLLLTAVAVWVVLGMYPGKIARERNHPQAEAIAVCGWWGVVTFGLLLPIAWIWAYTKIAAGQGPSAEARKTSSADRETSEDKGANP